MKVCIERPNRTFKRVFNHCDVIRIYGNHLDELMKSKVRIFFTLIGATHTIIVIYRLLKSYSESPDDSLGGEVDLAFNFALPIIPIFVRKIIQALAKLFGHRITKFIIRQILKRILKKLIKDFLIGSVKRYVLDKILDCKSKRVKEIIEDEIRLIDKMFID